MFDVRCDFNRAEIGWSWLKHWVSSNGSKKMLKHSLKKSHLYMDDILCIKWDGPLGWHIGSPDGSRLKQEAKGKCGFVGHLTVQNSVILGRDDEGACI